ncbi:MAG: 2-C-methyl-D-erythritol 4-phosphate cytidylyltransferase [Treponema sp.]|jgi:2-C-methyl-D-erythritol 4-phosphate cytidylyltransferase/2-C-methyl-D-erythritol 4-phosphate cytidylyltransferase/2-C-methyl-D-erythritol 2,4-cyclodiphosphate synthase|nr:2-C-methyl-D-erythritol 4-phosphate cytidylyltransferase [Treponema sp.]
MEAAAVVCAAGASVRMGGIKKEYQKLNSCLTVLESSVRAFASVPSIEVIVIAICAGTEDAARAALSPETLSAQMPKIQFVNGGESRRASVFNALSLLSQYNPCYVLIHDGARPWVTVNLIKSALESVKKYGAVIPLLPLMDTPKECDTSLCEQEVFIKRHLKRVNTGAAQTPQAFKFPEILYVHQKAAEVKDEEFTDDAEIWGRFCGQVAVIPGEPENRKITFQGDI